MIKFTSGSEMKAFNTEALKLAAQGVTIIVASGDDGAANSNSNGNCLCGKTNILQKRNNKKELKHLF